MSNVKILMIAALAGLASVIAVYSAIYAGAAASPVLVLSALPIYVAALAWGTQAGVAASIIAILASATLISPQAAIVIGLAITIPASIVGHQANLAQEMEDGQMEWYPLTRLLFNLAIILALALAAVGFFADYQSYTQSPQVVQAIDEYLRQFPPSTPLTDTEVKQLSESVFRIMPFIFAGIWLIIHIVNLQLAAMITRASSLLPRPKDDIISIASLPRIAIGILIVSLLGAMFLGGGLQAIAAVFAGSLLVAFSLVGLAGMHLRARNNPVGFFTLVIIYLLIVLFFIPLYLLAVPGVIRSFNQPSTNPPAAGNT
ncbi:MAG: hypothetical protein AAF217_09590 [Pseudomonadota bacterium]